MILVTGATGSIGGQLTKQLDGKGQKVRALVRDAKKAEKLKGKNVEIVQGDLSKPDTLAKAFQGVDTAFILMSGGDQIPPSEKNAFDAAKRAGVKHVVLLSVPGASTSSPIALARWHGESEENLKKSGLSYSILGPSSFMQNLIGNAGSIKGEGKIYGSSKTGRFPMIDVVDIAATAAAILIKPAGHEGKTYHLTGPEALSMATVADKIGKAVGKSVTYVDLPTDTFVANMKKMGFPGWLADDFGKMNEYFASDQASATSDAVEKITGRKPRTIDAFLSDNAQAFK